MSAVSIRLTPAPRQMSICCRAALTSRLPTGLAQPVPPNPIVPRVTVDTFRPDRPSCLYSMPVLLCIVAGWCAPDTRYAAPFGGTHVHVGCLCDTHVATWVSPRELTYTREFRQRAGAVGRGRSPSGPYPRD